MSWSVDVDKKTIDSWKNDHYSSSYGAVGIALLLAVELMGFDFFEESVFGTGIDFWAGNSDLTEDAPNSRNITDRIEISGIAKENQGNSVNMRIERKKKQITASDNTKLPGWIMVVEFSTPKTKIIKK